MYYRKQPFQLYRRPDEPPAETPPPSGGGSGNPNPEDETVTLTKAELQKRIDDNTAAMRRSIESKFNRQIEELKAERDRKEAESAGQFKDLYEKTLGELTDLKAQFDTAQSNYNAVVESSHRAITAEVAEWPEEVRVLDPGVSVDLSARQIWLEKTKPLAEKLIKLNRSPEGESGGGVGGGNPPPKGESSDIASATRNLMKREFEVPKFE